MATKRTAATLAVVTTVTAGAFGLSLLPGGSPVAQASGLTPYDSCTQLLRSYRAELVRNARAYPSFGYLEGVGGGAPAITSGTARSSDKAVGTSGTGTNVQEAGVDEPDTAKLAGDVLVVAAGNTIRLVTTTATPVLLGTVRLGERAYSAQLLVEGTRVLALTQTYDQEGNGSQQKGALSDVRYGGGGFARTVATLIDIADPRAPTVLETSTTDGRLVSARLAGGRVRLVVSTAPRPQTVSYPTDGRQLDERQALLRNRAFAARTPLARILPQRERRSGAGAVLEKGPAVACSGVSYPTGGGGTSTLTVTSLDLQKSLAPTGTVAVNADGDLVYASTATIYVATSRWGTTFRTASAPESTEVTTELHEFALTPDSADYRATGSIPGYLLSSYSLSEHAGHLRVVTTREPTWQGDQGGVAPDAPRTSASLLVLKDNGRGELVTTGRVDGLGKGERVYAVRFLGDVGTVVTFRQTDPLYTLDLSDPTAPRVVGELKIPGFSNYLHPIGGDTLVGIGQDADLQGRVKGLQLATFDLSDLASPTRTRTLNLGPGYSEAAYDPHAFSYDVGLGTVMLPISDDRGAVSLLAIKASATELREVGRMTSRAEDYTRRAFVVGGRVLAVSETGVVAATAPDLRPTGSVRFA